MIYWYLLPLAATKLFVSTVLLPTTLGDVKYVGGLTILFT